MHMLKELRPMEAALPVTGNAISDPLYGDAVVSVSYYYNTVPEPTSVALLGMGFMTLLFRRPKIRKCV